MSDLDPTPGVTITVGVGQLRSDITGLIRHISTGAVILILRRGRPAVSMSDPTTDDADKPPRASTAVSVTELRTRASRYLDRAECGEVLDIVQRAKIVARLSGLPPGHVTS